MDPPQPNLSIKDRSPEALLEAVAEWHRGLNAVGIRKLSVWQPSGIAPFRFEENPGESPRIYSITELLSSTELDEEGRAMGHCVGSYAGSCESGRVSIWSVKVVEPPAPEMRLLTLEVSNQDRQIVQARRRFNNLPEPKELEILERWASEGGPRLSQMAGEVSEGGLRLSGLTRSLTEHS